MDKILNVVNKMDEKELRACLRASYINPAILPYRAVIRARLLEKKVEARLIERMERDFIRTELAKAA
jgi:hypothetical protein